MKEKTVKRLIIVGAEILLIAAVFVIVDISNLYRVKPVSIYDISRPRPYSGIPPTKALQKIDELRLFKRFNNTRGVGLDGSTRIVLLLPGMGGENERWYYEKMMVTLSKQGISSIYIDVLESQDFIPIYDEKGNPYTVEGRRLAFLQLISSYAKGCGFKELIVWSFSTSAGLARRFAFADPACIAWVDYFGFEDLETSSEWPSHMINSMIVIGSVDKDLNGKKVSASNAEKSGVHVKLVIIPDTYEWLSDRNGDFSAKAWDRAMAQTMLFVSSI